MPIEAFLDFLYILIMSYLLSITIVSIGVFVFVAYQWGKEKVNLSAILSLFAPILIFVLTMPIVCDMMITFPPETQQAFMGVLNFIPAVFPVIFIIGTLCIVFDRRKDKHD